MPRLVIQTGARLHFGLLSVGQPLDEPAPRRQFGGLGVMIDSPGFKLAVSPACEGVARPDSPSVPPRQVPFPALAERIQRTIAQYRESCPREFLPPDVQVELLWTIPQHVGLGSGTQLALAIARLLSEMAQEPMVPVEELARRVGRGQRSAVGLYGFAQGGLLVEGGKQQADGVSPLIARLEFPPEWRFILARPRTLEGLSGEAERRGFQDLSAMPARVTDRLCRLLLLGVLPAMVERDFAGFCDSLQAYGDAVGEFFAPVQGGVFAAARMAELCRMLRDQGIRGIAQTSWGPTVAISCANVAAARTLQQHLVDDPAWSDCEFEIAAGKNTGATVHY